MKAISTVGCKLLSCSLGDPEALTFRQIERDAWLASLAMHGDFILGSTDSIDLPPATDVEFWWLWNGPSATSAYSAMRPEPIPGLIVTITASDLTRIVGMKFSLRWRFAYQVGTGYNGGAPPTGVTHEAMFELENDVRSGIRIMIVPAQVVNGRLCLAMPYIQSANNPGFNNIRQEGVIAPLTANVRAITRHETTLRDLSPAEYTALH